MHSTCSHSEFFFIITVISLQEVLNRGHGLPVEAVYKSSRLYPGRIVHIVSVDMTTMNTAIVLMIPVISMTPITDIIMSLTGLTEGTMKRNQVGTSENF